MKKTMSKVFVLGLAVMLAFSVAVQPCLAAGTSAGIEFVPIPTHMLTYYGGTGYTGSVPPAQLHEEGEIVTAHGPLRMADFAFAGWRYNGPPTVYNNRTLVSGGIIFAYGRFVMPEGEVTLTALWNKEDGPPTNPDKPKPPEEVKPDKPDITPTPTPDPIPDTIPDTTPDPIPEPSQNPVQIVTPPQIISTRPIVSVGNQPGDVEQDIIEEEEPPLEVEDTDIQDQEIPRIVLGNESIPLFPPIGKSSWALLNLLLCVLGAAYAIVTVIRALLRRKSEKKEEQNTYKLELVTNAQKASEEKEEKKLRHGWLVVAIIMGIIGVLLFVLTQDMRSPMTLMDWWTIAHVLIFAAEVIAVVFTFKKKKEDEKEEEEQSTANS